MLPAADPMLTRSKSTKQEEENTTKTDLFDIAVLKVSCNNISLARTKNEKEILHLNRSINKTF